MNQPYPVIRYGILLGAFIVLALLSVRLFRRLRWTGPSPVLAFLLFGVATFLVSEVYWGAYNLMIRDSAPAFAAMEIAEAGGFLCYASSLRAALGYEIGRDLRALAVTVGFMACNTALWIAWTGSWVKDVLTGAAMCYLVYTCLRGAIRHRVFSRPVWLAFLAGILMIFVLQAAALVIGGGTGSLLDNLCEPVWLAGILYFLVRSLRPREEDTGRDSAMVLSWMGFTWCTLAMYLSYEPFYFLPCALYYGMIVLMVRSAEQEVTAG